MHLNKNADSVSLEINGSSITKITDIKLTEHRAEHRAIESVVMNAIQIRLTRG